MQGVMNLLLVPNRSGRVGGMALCPVSLHVGSKAFWGAGAAL